MCQLCVVLIMVVETLQYSSLVLPVMDLRILWFHAAEMIIITLTVIRVKMLLFPVIQVR